ncbi:MAG TPA: hypothetical protein VHK69_09415 [Chitinophagaceae bacterium]|nr:hypothetical protein [Chitinophagaceae bacterium]
MNLLSVFLITGCVLLLWLNFRVRRRQTGEVARNRLRRFSRLGSRHGLNFTAQEVLPRAIIGVDGPRRKLLIFREHALRADTVELIDLQEVKHCVVETRRSGRDARQQDILLRFEGSKKVLAVVLFCSTRPDHATAHRWPGQRARNWAQVIRKMLPGGEKGIREGKGDRNVPPPSEPA